MAQRFVQDASGALAQVYNPAQATIQNQIPSVQSLYDTLIQGLQGGVDTGTQAVVNSANRRGVGSAGLAGQVGGALSQEAALQNAQLNAQRAGDISAISGNLTGLGVGRAQAATDLAGTMNSEDIQRQQATLEQKRNQIEYQQRLQSAERDAEIARIQAARVGSRRSATSSAKELNSDAREILRKYVGRDGKVSPDRYNEVLDLYVRAGGNADSFHSAAKSFVNTSHADDYYGGYRNLVERRSAQPVERNGKQIATSVRAPSF